MAPEPGSEESMEQVVRRDGRYPMGAYEFLHEGLSVAVKETHGEDPESLGEGKHVTGKQLCLALRRRAIDKWGRLAKTVLTTWNIHGTIDFGNMVYLLIENGLWRKTPEDSLEDFRDVYDFETAFAVVNEFELKE